MAQPRRVVSTSRPILILGAVVLALYFAREILVPLALAITLSFVLNPLVTTLQRLRFGRIPASLLVVLLFVGAAGGVGWMVGTQLLDVANDLPHYRDNIRAKIAALHAPSGGPIGKATQAVNEIGKELTANNAPPAPATEKTRAARRGAITIPNSQPGQPVAVQIVEPVNDLKYLRDLLTPALKPLSVAGVVLVFTLFIVVKREDLRNRMLRLAGLGQLNVMTQALDDGAQRISRYLMMQFLVNAGYGATFGLGVYLIGIPHAALWGTIAGVLRIIPYAGALAAAGLPLILALAVFNTWLPPVLVVVLYIGVEGVLGNFIEPWLYGAHTGVSSLALLVSTVFWTVLWGWAGLLLSTPLTVCVIVLGQYVPHLAFLHILLGDEEPLSPDAQFYQRLLAMDSTEARLIAESFLKGKTLVELYDQVFVPALAMAEQDRHKGSLDETRESFVYLSANELIAELADHQPEPDAVASLEATAHPGRSVPYVLERIISIPASDQADEITASMLSQLVEQAGFSALTFPAGSPWDEALKRLSPGQADVVCVAALPPFAFTHTRAACQLVRAIAPEVKLIAGIWGFPGDLDKAKQRFGAGRPDYLLTTLTAALQQITAWNAPAGTPSESSERVEAEVANT